MRFSRTVLLLVVLPMLLLLTASAPKPKIPVVVITTPYGEISLYLYEGTPKHRANFLKLARDTFFNGTTFHRVINEFMIQGGDPNSKDADPNNDGSGGPGYEVDAEISPKYYHKKGALAAARNGDDVNPQRRSSGSQFYIVHGKKFRAGELDTMALQKYARNYWNTPTQRQRLAGMNMQALAQTSQGRDSLQRLYKRLEDEVKTSFDQQGDSVKYSAAIRQAYTTQGGSPHLDGSYTVFGEVVGGLNLVDSIATVKTDGRDRPLKDVTMTVRVVEMTAKEFQKKYGIKPPVGQ